MNIEENMVGETQLPDENSLVENELEEEDSSLMFIEDRSLRAAMPSLMLPRRATLTTKELHQRIAERAYERFQARGRIHGHDLEDWLAAERLVLNSLKFRKNNKDNRSK